MSKTPSIYLGDHHQSFVADLLKSGRYQNVSEVLRAGLRLLEDQEQQREAVAEELRNAIREGFASGPAQPMESAEDLIQEFKKRHSA